MSHEVSMQLSDLERLVPDLVSDDPIEQTMIALHRERYAFAGRFVDGKTVLDIACGAGYGSAMLRDAGAQSVMGVDLSAAAISYARGRYAAPGISFLEGDGMRFVPDAPVDVAVSLETIEHLPHAHDFVSRLSGFVKAEGGLVIGSVPTTLSTDVNPYHLHDFSVKRFRRLFRERGLTIVDELEQTQPYSPLKVRKLAQSSQRKYEFRQRLPLYYATHPIMAWRRFSTTLRHGFVNKYLLLVGRKG
jgi:cyclopropane fatty-acyl-phospholipid synthase-like methyltransferase